MRLFSEGKRPSLDQHHDFGRESVSMCASKASQLSTDTSAAFSGYQCSWMGVAAAQEAATGLAVLVGAARGDGTGGSRDD